MQTCSKCLTQSPDNIKICPNCQANLAEFSTTAVARRRLQENTRVNRIRLSVAADACPVCQEMQGTYPKGQVPILPIEGCSHANGCRCFYEPVLDEIYP